ncbi:hypothetical protein [Rhizobium leguminosarum]
MAYLLLVVFVASAALLVFVLPRNKFYWPLFVVVFILVVLAIYLSTSPSSPFGSTARSTLGPDDVTYSVLVGVVGALLGVVGSCLSKLGGRRLSLHYFYKPLAASPLTLIPVIKLIEASDGRDLLTLLLLFALSYQTGFFWERLLNEPK